MLYHYTTKEGLYGILDSKKFWLVASSEMSDISDRFYGNLFATVELLKSANETVKLLSENLTTQDILDVNMETFHASFYSMSFCEDCNNEFLWDNYTEHNTGFAVGIDESYFLSSVQNVVNNNYKQLDYEDVPQNILEFRKVQYRTLKSKFEEIVNKLKPDDYILEHNKNAYKDWLLFTLSILAGIIKAKEYEPEQEIRILFQNRYSKEYENRHPIQLLFSFSKKDALIALGLSGEPVCIIENSTKTKKRFELNLTSFFNSQLIPEVYVGDKCQIGCYELKDKLKSSGLISTKLLNRKGEEL